VSGQPPPGKKQVEWAQETWDDKGLSWRRLGQRQLGERTKPGHTGPGKGGALTHWHRAGGGGGVRKAKGRGQSSLVEERKQGSSEGSGS
jgi:hypothetical protein